jgi:hypothetical protein
MEYEEVIQRIGRDDVTATFGCAPPEEIVGPLKPEGVYYGQAFGYDEDIEEFVLHHPIPLITFTFNKYRPDLPPWEQVREFVLASQDDGGVVEATFIDPSLRGVNTTGPLKTVELHAEGPGEGVEGAIVTRDAVAEKRGMTRGNVRDGSEFRVDGVLD